MSLVLKQTANEQPPVRKISNNELNVAIASLSLGGAERIVLDWARRIYPKWKVHLIVLRDRPQEWPIPPFVRATRLHGKDFSKELTRLGKNIAEDGNGICVAHLLSKKERLALAEGGATIIPVLHNAKEGWPGDVSHLEGALNVIAVSESCARDLRENGWDGPISVIRHIPSRPNANPDAREFFRKAWNIPQDATVIGMIGAVKEQKNYPLALRILKAFLEKRNAYLVIVGGPVANHRKVVWQTLVEEIQKTGVRSRVAMPGFIPNAAECMPAFDILMNTSRFEGLSIATLEALVYGLPVVATAVGGQGEVGHEGLTLMPRDSSERDWVLALEKSLASKPPLPSWVNFPAYKQWTLAGLARHISPSDKVLFVTANLNSGGAQRSLINLALHLKGVLPFSILVAGNSTASYFYRELESADIEVERASDIWDAFSLAESLVDKVVNEHYGTVCFWNVDARVKLLSVKALAFTKTRFIDVSPGEYLFEEMEATDEFQNLTAFKAKDYYQRLSRLVLKYDGPCPIECVDKKVVIANGIPLPKQSKTDYSIRTAPRIVVNGRIAPTKFIVEIINAVEILWKKVPNAQLHIFGAAEPLHEEYARDVLNAAEEELSKRIFFHGSDFTAKERLWEFDAYVVLGKNQGCPNALLEALAAGLPAVGNNDGGTKEQIIHEKTGLLINSCDPTELAQALERLLTDRVLAGRLGENGRKHVERNFSMKAMVRSYAKLFADTEICKDSVREKAYSLIREFIRNAFSSQRLKPIKNLSGA